MNHSLRAAAALILTATIALCSGGTAFSAELPSGVSMDIAQSYHLLATSAYAEVEPQAILDAAVAALGAAAKKKGVHLTLSAIQADGSADALSVLENTIVGVAPKLHLTPTDTAYIAINGMASALKDKYTVFFTPKEFKDFNNELDPAKISGIGILVGYDDATGYPLATYVVPGTPADRAGIQAGDDLIDVDGTATKGFKGDNMTKLLRGQTGTVVHVTVARAGKPIGAPLAIVRAQVEPPTVIYSMLPNQVGYLAIFAFGEETPDQFDAALAKVQAAGARALVVDLRGNGGGYVLSALQISAEFISNKPLYTVEQRGEEPTTITADPSNVIPLPLAVLVDGYSASASEITAGALQDDGVGTLVGAKTFGKGVMQTVTQLPDGAAIKITTAHYLTPSNRDINLKGIIPNVDVAENANARFGDPAHDAQLSAALALLQKKIALAK